MGQFQKPPSLQLPEGVSDGESFDAVGTFVVHEDHLTLVKIDGEVVPGYEKDAERLDKGLKVPRGTPGDTKDTPMEDQLQGAFATRRGY